MKAKITTGVIFKNNKKDELKEKCCVNIKFKRFPQITLLISKKENDRLHQFMNTKFKIAE